MGGPRFFDLDYRERDVLADGTPVVMRLVTAADKPLLRAGFEQMSQASRYARFLAPKASLSDDELRYLTEIDYEQHFAIGAERPESSDGGPPIGLGLARFIRLPDAPNTAEAAIAVIDEVQHLGLGKLLFLRLVAAAAERGIERFRCEVLVGNGGMAALIAQIDPERTVDAINGVMSIELSLPPVTPTQPASEPSEATQNPMYRLFRAAAANAIEWTEAIRKLWRR